MKGHHHTESVSEETEKPESSESEARTRQTLALSEDGAARTSGPFHGCCEGQRVPPVQESGWRCTRAEPVASLTGDGQSAWGTHREGLALDGRTRKCCFRKHGPPPHCANGQRPKVCLPGGVRGRPGRPVSPLGSSSSHGLRELRSPARSCCPLVATWCPWAQTPVLPSAVRSLGKAQLPWDLQLPPGLLRTPGPHPGSRRLLGTPCPPPSPAHALPCALPGKQTSLRTAKRENRRHGHRLSKRRTPHRTQASPRTQGAGQGPQVRSRFCTQVGPHLPHRQTAHLRPVSHSATPGQPPAPEGRVPAQSTTSAPQPVHKTRPDSDSSTWNDPFPHGRPRGAPH